MKKQVCDFYQVPESSITSENRTHLVSRIHSLVALFYSEQAGSVSQVADYLGKEVSTLSRQLNNLKQMMMNDKQLQQEIEVLKNVKTQV